jgi:hypothetical protein
MARADDRGADKPAPNEGSDPAPKAQRRKRLPSADSIISEKTLTSPKGRVYRIIKTNQTDAYDEPAGKPSGEAGGRSKEKPTRKGKRRRKS